MMDYIKDRLDDQINWYSSKSRKLKKKYDIIQFVIIILTSTTPIVNIITITFDYYKTIVSILSSIPAIVVVILISMSKHKKYFELHTKYRSTCEKLKQEKFLYLVAASVYDIDDCSERLKLLAQRVESICAHENGEWAQLNELKSNKIIGEKYYENI